MQTSHLYLQGLRNMYLIRPLSPILNTLKSNSLIRNFKQNINTNKIKILTRFKSKSN